MTASTHRMKRPAFQWYPGDARRDVALQACSLEARGLWREMMDLMHDGEPYGHLTAGDVPMTDEQLARIVGLTLPKLRKLVAELELHKVFSRNASGVIYSRRMVRDEHIREVRAHSGKLGGNPALLDKQKDKQPPNQTVKQTPTPAVAVASAVALDLGKVGTSGAGNAAPPASASPRCALPELPPAALEFGKAFYAGASPERRADVAAQLLATLADGATLNGNAKRIRAQSPARLEAKCREVIAKPPRQRDKAIVILLLKLADTTDGSAPGHIAEATATVARRREERTGAQRTAAAESWLADRPDVEAELEGYLLDEGHTNPKDPTCKIMRRHALLQRWEAAGAPLNAVEPETANA